MSLSKDTIRRWIRDLVDKYGTNDPYRLAEALAIEIHEINNGNNNWIARALQDKRTGIWVIVINHKSPEEERAFGVAHELMHILIHQRNPLPRGDDLEILCDFGANEIIRR
ncbi:MAG TPA: ImmA/IrrE family metallo-endopeptidase [bacterium]|nr:ImmA/IrrE family metallo-endopeptidase [bacterium]